MEGILALVLIETFLINTATEFERRKRLKLLTKWATGNITMQEITFLKKQAWCQKNVKQVTVPPEKKDD